MTLRLATADTPVGPLAFLVDADGVVVASAFGTPDDAHRQLPPELAYQPYERVSRVPGVTDAVEAWVAGDLGALDDLPVRQPGSVFLQAAWKAMRTIPPGSTWSYSELAAAAGRPNGARAAGGACARNRVAPFVPCHRIVASDGSLGGYAYGLPAKRALLAHEGATGTLPGL